MAKHITSGSPFFDDLEDERDHEFVRWLLRGNMSDVNNITKYPPEKLYLYKNMYSSHAIEQIENSTIHFSTPDKFNDPFDSIFAKSIFYASIENVLSKMGKSVNMRYFNRIYSDVENIKKELKISCLTESNKDIKMWAYYADAHKGVCIEYDSYGAINKKGDAPFVLWPVFYTDKLQNLLEEVKVVTSRGIQFHFTPEIIQLMALCKLKIWKDEKEWRVIERTESFKEDNRVLPITGLYLGLKISNNDKKKILKIAKRKSIPCYQMEVTHTELGIVPGKRLV